MNGVDAGYQAVVPGEVLWSAWRSVRLLGGHTEGQEPAEMAAELRRMVLEYGQEQIARGYTLLIGVLCTFIVKQVRDTAADIDPLRDLLPAILGQLRRLLRADERGPAAEKPLPVLTAVLTAGLLEQDVTAWWERHPSPDRAEDMGLAYLVYLLADFIDSTTREGATHELLQAVLTEETELPRGNGPGE